MHRCDFTAIAVAAAVGLSASYACAQEFTAHLKGLTKSDRYRLLFRLSRLPPRPLRLRATPGRSCPTAQVRQSSILINRPARSTYTLTYSNVGTTPPQTGAVSQAHIHFGKSRDSGGILVFFWTNLTFSGTGPTPQACPQNSGTVSGTWTAADVQAIAGQNCCSRRLRCADRCADLEYRLCQCPHDTRAGGTLHGHGLSRGRDPWTGAFR